MAYLDDIFEQPRALRRVVDAYAAEPFTDLPLLQNYDRVILTGMGGSHFANYYLWRQLLSAGHPVEWIRTDEILSQPALPSETKTLVIAVSQSGLSGEVVAWVDVHSSADNIDVLAVTNNKDAERLTGAARFVALIHAGPEATVGTKTYLNTLAVNRLLGSALTGADTAPVFDGLLATADAIGSYLDRDHRDDFGALIAADESATTKLIVGRGAAYGTAVQGALIVKEAAKLHYEGISAGQFRHGPLDLADERLLVWLMTDGDYMHEENAQLVTDLRRFGASVFTSGTDIAGATHIPIPEVPQGFEEFARILPVELVNIPLAEAGGNAPGEFRHNDKITTKL